MPIARELCQNFFKQTCSSIESSVDWLLNVTIKDISAVYGTAHRFAGGLKKKLDLRSGSQRHRHFVGFFNVPVQARTWDHPLQLFRVTAPFQSPFTTRMGIRRTYSHMSSNIVHCDVKQPSKKKNYMQLNIKMCTNFNILLYSKVSLIYTQHKRYINRHVNLLNTYGHLTLSIITFGI